MLIAVYWILRVCVFDFISMLSRVCYLVVVERLAWSLDPKSYTVWSYAPGMVTHGGKVKVEVPRQSLSVHQYPHVKQNHAQATS